MSYAYKKWVIHINNSLFQRIKKNQGGNRRVRGGNFRSGILGPVWFTHFLEFVVLWLKLGNHENSWPKWIPQCFGLMPCELLSRVYSTNTVVEGIEIVKKEVGMDALTSPDAALEQELLNLRRWFWVKWMGIFNMVCIYINSSTLKYIL